MDQTRPEQVSVVFVDKHLARIKSHSNSLKQDIIKYMLSHKLTECCLVDIKAVAKLKAKKKAARKDNELCSMLLEVIEEQEQEIVNHRAAELRALQTQIYKLTAKYESYFMTEKLVKNRALLAEERRRLLKEDASLYNVVINSVK